MPSRAVRPAAPPCRPVASEPQRHDDGSVPGTGRRPASGGVDACFSAETGGYKTFFTGKWHLGEADYALPNAQGYDEMKYAAFITSTPTPTATKWFPDMDPELRAMFQRVTKGALSGNAGEPANEEFKINGQYVNTPDKGVVGIPFFDGYVEQASLDYLDSTRRTSSLSS